MSWRPPTCAWVGAGETSTRFDTFTLSSRFLPPKQVEPEQIQVIAPAPGRLHPTT